MDAHGSGLALTDCIEQFRVVNWQRTHPTERSKLSSVCLVLCNCCRAWLWTLESAVPLCLSWHDDSILNPSSKITDSFRTWLKSKLLRFPLSPFPITASDTHLLYWGTTDPHTITVIQSKTNLERDYFSVGSISQVQSFGWPQGWQRKTRDSTAGTLWGTWQDCNCLAYNGSSGHRTFPVRCNKENLAAPCVSKPWVGHLTSHLKHAQLTQGKERTVLRQRKVTAKPPTPTGNDFHTHAN